MPEHTRKRTVFLAVECCRSPQDVGHEVIKETFPWSCFTLSGRKSAVCWYDSVVQMQSNFNLSSGCNWHLLVLHVPFLILNRTWVMAYSAKMQDRMSKLKINLTWHAEIKKATNIFSITLGHHFVIKILNNIYLTHIRVYIRPHSCTPIYSSNIPVR